ncbi:hypothetical protein [Candidatus Liberibacter americanus]|uniref:hypothetical protein n=1 Tax=Candidatus Liberibacter americanus TaxID=309868 RepID=UPI000346600B|nr:hypothetical protein [Candidatus Liberibacter americanus]
MRGNNGNNEKTTCYKIGSVESRENRKMRLSNMLRKNLHRRKSQERSRLKD